MDNVLFYTFSTIAASFGSAVGIIVAAAIFRMQRIDQVAADLANELLKYHPDDRMALAEYNQETQVSRLNRIISVQNWRSFIDVWKEFHKDTHPENYWEKHLFDLLGKVVARQKEIRRGVSSLVIYTVLLIGLCFFELAFSKSVE
jgi:hypothetical protein